MHVLKLLHKKLSASAAIHKKRLNRLLLCSESVAKGAQLTLTEIGQGTQGAAFAKHKIKAVQRLLTNTHLLKERKEIYQQLASMVLSGKKSPVLLVDWSSCNNRKTQVLRASVVFDGRSITIYEKVYDEKEQNKKKTHAAFLTELSHVIPSYCQPIIVTDAGFRTDWFRLILEKKWDFIGRVRNNASFLQKKINAWKPCREMQPQHINRAEWIGKVLLTQSNSLSLNLLIYQGKLKGRKSLKSNHGKSKIYSQSHREPWVIATSLSREKITASRVVKLYAKRMQIEQTFRDMKNASMGNGLTLSRSTGEDKLNILLLIAKIAEFILFLVGIAGEREELHYRYQASSVKHKRVLSLFSLGKRIIRDSHVKIPIAEIKTAIQYIAQYEVFSYA